MLEKNIKKPTKTKTNKQKKKKIYKQTRFNTHENGREDLTKTKKIDKNIVKNTEELFIENLIDNFTSVKRIIIKIWILENKLIKLINFFNEKFEFF